MKIIAALICLLMISGCASLRQGFESMTERTNRFASYVEPGISESDADEVTEDMSQFLMYQLPPAKTTLELEPLKSPLHGMFVDQLAYKGFGVVQNNLETEQQWVQLRYLVTRLDWGLLVRLRYRDIEASRFYDRTVDGRLSLQTSYTVREVTK